MHFFPISQCYNTFVVSFVITHDRMNHKGKVYLMQVIKKKLMLPLITIILFDGKVTAFLVFFS